MNQLRYLWVILRHKWFVGVAGVKLRVPIWRLIVHDGSKLSRAEWGPYLRRFYDGRSGRLDHELDPDEFHRAFVHHWHRNSHHWEHWLAFGKSGTYRAMEMPDVSVREMVADWLGAGRAYTGAWGATEWYLKNCDTIVLHPKTRSRVHELLALPDLEIPELKELTLP